ncbi:hypothetical protein C0991_005686 [Blastosporella zonata]|nr:hypothetical protein C0991_005686 [Blastosporella zonata]
MENTKQALQEEELCLISALSAVRTKLNEFTLISSLPTEVLEYIFGICVFWMYDPRRQKHRLAWTQVCRKWRCISLNAARLWHFIDLADAPLASKCLVRSASAPIHLTTSTWKLRADDLLSAHAPRVQSIDVLLFPLDLVHLFKRCGPELPALTRLSLKVPPVCSNFVLEVSTLPSLRSLTLLGVAIPWNICAGLTYLSLGDLIPGYSPTLWQFLVILEASPYIEEIHLEHVRPTPSDTDPCPSSLIPLTSLRRLSIMARTPLNIRTILSYIPFPPTARLIIDCNEFESLNDLFPTSASTMYSDLRACAIHFKENSFELYDSASSEPIISIKTHGAHLPTITPDFFDTSDVTTLEIDHTLPEPIADTLVAFFARLPALETIRVTDSSLFSSVIAALSKPVGQNGMLCQKLRSICFWKSREHWERFEKEGNELLLSLAKSRRNASFSVKLQFMQSGVLHDNIGHERSTVSSSFT